MYAKKIFFFGNFHFVTKIADFRAFFLLFTASVRSRPPGPPGVPGVFLTTGTECHKINSEITEHDMNNMAKKPVRNMASKRFAEAEVW